MTTSRMVERLVVTIALAGLLGGCGTCPHRASTDRTNPPPRAPGYYGTPESETKMKGLAKTDQDEQVVESDSQEVHYSGVGGIHFEYWIIHYRSDSSQCYSLSSLNAKAFTVTGDPMFCGVPTKSFQTLHIKNSDIVP